MNPNPFLEAIETVLGGPLTGHLNSPSQLLAQWEQFVDWCKDGYRWDVAEYFNELAVRGRLELILTAERLQTFRELQELEARVSEIDLRFKSLLRPGVQLPNRKTWWEQGVLTRAGKQYADYYREAHGIQVDVV